MQFRKSCALVVLAISTGCTSAAQQRLDVVPTPSHVYGISTADPFQHGLMITALGQTGCDTGEQRCPLDPFGRMIVAFELVTTRPLATTLPDPLPSLQAMVCETTSADAPQDLTCFGPFAIEIGKFNGSVSIKPANSSDIAGYATRYDIELWVGAKPSLGTPHPPMMRMARAMTVIPDKY